MRIDRHNIQSVLLSNGSELLTESKQSALVFDLESLERLGCQAALSLWCRQQPCPVIGIGTFDSSLLDCVDVVVADEAELSLILQRVSDNPQAATVLVQVLRSVEHLPPEQGLVVESLAYATLQSGEEFKRWLKKYRDKNSPEPAKESGPPILVDREQHQLTLTLNRPENSNAYSVELRDALMESLQMVALDKSIEKVTVTANGRCFSTGGELSEFGLVESPIAGHLIRSQVSPAKLILSEPERYHFHVHKACVGSGIELPACAGYLTANAKTFFWLPELSMGLIPGAGGCVSITRRIGRHRTAYLVLTNKKIDAQKALQWGLIDEIREEKGQKSTLS